MYNRPVGPCFQCEMMGHLKRHCPKSRVQQYPFHCDVVDGSNDVAKRVDVNSVCMVHGMVHCDVCVGETLSQSGFINSNGGIDEAKLSNPSSDFCQCVCSGGEDHAGDQLGEGSGDRMGQVVTETLANQGLPSVQEVNNSLPVLAVSVGVDEYSNISDACHWEAHRRIEDDIDC